MSKKNKKSISIVGGGTAALFLASFLDKEKFNVTIYEANKSLGRKFLVAGDGGFNLTHSEKIVQFVERYTPASFLKEALNNFSNEDLIRWLHEIGITTFVGSSGRIFPVKGIKPIEVLDAITARLKEIEVAFKFNHEFSGWDKQGELVFNENEIVKSDIKVFALGGASWKVTGSTGKWLKPFKKEGIKTMSFESSNCAFGVNWPKGFLEKYEGEALKNITISCDGDTQKGEVVITDFGLEGNAIYALSPQIQKQLTNGRVVKVTIDFKKVLDEVSVFNTLKNSSLNTTNVLRKKLKLSPVQIELLKLNLTKDEFTDHEVLAQKIKKFPLVIVEAAAVDQAISTTGGIALEAVDSTFQLKEMPDNYCIGEMLNWNAPTGGYLIQGCASMGVFLAKCLNK